MAGRIYSIEKLSYPQIEFFDRDKTIFIIAISPLEEHGPHLPIGVDAFNAYFFARHTAETIIEYRPECDVLLFPLLPLGTQVYKHIGSFSIKPTSLYDIVYNTGRGLAIYGFKNIFVLSAHGTPRQIVAVEAACRKVAKKDNVRMFNLAGALTSKFLSGEFYDKIARRLGREFTADEKYLLKYDFHAGWWETSMMLYQYPDLVDNSFAELEPFLKNLISGEIITKDRKWQGYYGAPAKADKAFAQASIDVFTDHTRELIFRALEGEDIEPYIRSPFYKYRIFHPHFKRNAYVASAAILFLVMLVLLIKAYL